MEILVRDCASKHSSEATMRFKDMELPPHVNIISENKATSPLPYIALLVSVGVGG